MKISPATELKQARRRAAVVSGVATVVFLGFFGLVLLVSSSIAVEGVAPEQAPSRASDVSRTTEASPARPGSSSSERAAAAPSLESRVYRLEAEVRELRAALRAAGVGQAEAEAPPDDPLQDEGEPAAALAEAMDADPQVQAKLREVVQSELQRERDERWEARRARWNEMSAERVARFQEATGADEELTVKLQEILDAEQAAVAELFKAQGEGGWRGMRDQIRQLRTQTDDSVRAALEELGTLDDKHLGAWEELRESERRHWRGGRGGGRQGRGDEDDARSDDASGE